LADINAGERRILDALTRQGDTVFVALGPDAGHLRLYYRMPDLENAIAFDAAGLRALIQQWFVWASTTKGCYPRKARVTAANSGELKMLEWVRPGRIAS